MVREAHGVEVANVSATGLVSNVPFHETRLSWKKNHSATCPLLHCADLRDISLNNDNKNSERIINGRSHSSVAGNSQWWGQGRGGAGTSVSSYVSAESLSSGYVIFLLLKGSQRQDFYMNSFNILVMFKELKIPLGPIKYAEKSHLPWGLSIHDSQSLSLVPLEKEPVVTGCDQS